jgi:hypothetical protein
LFLAWIESDQPLGKKIYLACVTAEYFAETALQEQLLAEGNWTTAQINRMLARKRIRKMQPSRDCRGQAFLEKLHV